MISIEAIKNNYFPDHLSALRHSEYEFLFRDTIDFILAQHKLITNELPDDPLTDLLLPHAYHPNFIIDPETANHAQYESYLSQYFPLERPSKPETRIIKHPEEETDLVRILFQKFTPLKYEKIIERQKMLTLEQKENILNQYFTGHQSYPELDFLSYTFETAVNFLELEQLKTNNFQAFITLPVNPTFGYHTPEKIVNSGLLSTYVMTMKRSLDAFSKISGDLSTYACYLLPLAFQHKVIFTININQLLGLNSSVVADLWPLVKTATPTIYHNLQKSKQNYAPQ
ncbi:TPA: hypothetical protein DF272_05325 [Candidatus Falkowbacteria bacterium]|nr:hypothetical protein [Candidatus Falkowbacteria bacterium]